MSIFKKLLLFATVSLLLVFQSCEKDPDPVIKVGAAGFFVVNEGGFGNSNTSISFYDRKTDAISNNVFAAKNARQLGDQTQSMTVFEGKGYIVVQNSAKVEVINGDDFSSLATISEGLPSPRYFIGISSTKGYVSDWGADGITGTVKVIDLATFKVVKSIPVGKGTNRMLKVGNLVYVTNAGGYDKDNTVKVIDSSTDAVVTTITVGDNPNSLQRDSEGNIWIASDGAEAYNSDFSVDESKSTKGSISKVNAANVETMRLTVDKATLDGPKNLDISPSGTTLYYTYEGSVYSMATSTNTLPTTAFKVKNYYGLAVDPFNGNVIGCFAPNFNSAGSIDVYDPIGNLQKTYLVGIGPNGCAFK
jgi:YVTN family beta-propeller protein